MEAFFRRQKLGFLSSGKEMLDPMIDVLIWVILLVPLILWLDLTSKQDRVGDAGAKETEA